MFLPNQRTFANVKEITKIKYHITYGIDAHKLYINRR